MRPLLAQLSWFLVFATLSAANAFAVDEGYLFSDSRNGKNEDELMIPASTMKLVTATWALTRLGREFVIDQRALRNLAPQSVALLEKYFKLFRTSEADPNKRGNYEIGTAKVGPLIDRFLHRSTNSLGAILALTTYGQGNRYGRYQPDQNDFENALIEMRAWFSAFVANECPGRVDFAFGGFSGLNDLYWTPDYSNLEFELSILPQTVNSRGVSRSKMSGIRISPRAMNCMLRTMTRNANFSDLLASMSNPGQEGTTLNGRLGDGKEPNSSRIYAKTGTLPSLGVSALAGFIQKPDGTFSTFAYFINKRGSGVQSNRARIDQKVLMEFRDLSGLSSILDDVKPVGDQVPVISAEEADAEKQVFGENYFE